MENNTFLCSLCGSSFRERWELQSHNKKVHDKRVFKCEICTKEVIGQIKMVSHKQIHKKKACEIWEEQMGSIMKHSTIVWKLWKEIEIYTWKETMVHQFTNKRATNLSLCETLWMLVLHQRPNWGSERANPVQNHLTVQKVAPWNHSKSLIASLKKYIIDE